MATISSPFFTEAFLTICACLLFCSYVSSFNLHLDDFSRFFEQHMKVGIPFLLKFFCPDRLNANSLIGVAKLLNVFAGQLGDGMNVFPRSSDIANVENIV